MIDTTQDHSIHRILTYRTILRACHPSTTPPSACHPFSQPVILPHLYRQLVTHSVSLSSSHNSPPPPACYPLRQSVSPSNSPVNLSSTPSACHLSFPNFPVRLSSTPSAPSFSTNCTTPTAGHSLRQPVNHTTAPVYYPVQTACTTLSACHPSLVHRTWTTRRF